jgi:hypothetical protein
MGRPQISFAKRQREQAKRERQQLKAERRQQRKNEPAAEEQPVETVAETPLEPTPPAE